MLAPRGARCRVTLAKREVVATSAFLKLDPAHLTELAPHELKREAMQAVTATVGADGGTSLSGDNLYRSDLLDAVGRATGRGEENRDISSEESSGTSGLLF